jgi:diaminopimelate decarboxylase
MHGFHYQNGVLHCENVNLEALAKEHGTPLYVYSAHTIVDHFRRLNEALSPLDRLICYAMKASSNGAILNLLAREGAGFDIVSGVGKTREEIAYALEQGIYCFNVESEAELRAIHQVAESQKRKAPIAIRVNPDVEADTHKYISTGKSENKFGIGIDRAFDVYREAARLPWLQLQGVQIHIGSQITKPGPFAAAVEKMLQMVRDLKQEFGIRSFSVGGGIGIVYSSSLASGTGEWWKTEEASGHPLTLERYASAVVPMLEKLGLTIVFEPGRFVVGNAGVLLTRILYVKKTGSKKFLVADSGMNDLIRPALYEGYHEVVPVRESQRTPLEKADLVGPVCESGDFFAQDRELPLLEEGDLAALMSAGAYGFAMASTYNSRPLPAEVLVSGERAVVVRKRQTLEDLVAGEFIPTDLEV